MDIRWTSNVSDPEAKENLKKLILNSQIVLGRLLDIVEQEKRTLDDQETSESDFDTPDWAYRQAYRNGRRSELKKLRDLLNFKRG